MMSHNRHKSKSTHKECLCRIQCIENYAATGAASGAFSAAAAGAAPNNPASSDNAVTSPMVGTVYLASSPGGTPFVKPGDKVKAGDTLVIIEAMKVMNPIKATKAGVVINVLVSDAQPVEFGEPLLVIG